ELATGGDCKRDCRSHVFRGLDATYRRVRKSCLKEKSPVLSCLRGPSPRNNSLLRKHVHCCERAEGTECRDSCVRALKESASESEVIESMSLGGCGLVLPYKEPWTCFLRSESKQVEVAPEAKAPLDSAKMQCCQKARSGACWSLCYRTFSREWDMYTRFSEECLASRGESQLMQCINEVEEPCELGCNGLSFCTNFNNRGLELFRSCKADSDLAARLQWDAWKEEKAIRLQGVALPVGDVTLPIGDVAGCLPHVWKAVACALHVKPCHQRGHSVAIC
ncbi:unnamed protein product, partial [Darwinula stevensoni]